LTNRITKKEYEIMKSRKNKFLILFSTVTVLILFSVTAAFAAGLLNLPTGQVSATQVWLGASGVNGTVSTTLGGVPDGFDVTNGTYIGWCAEDNHQPNAPAGTLVTLLDSTDMANLPATYQGVPWDKVNYLLNNKAGTTADVQQALWLLTGTFDGTFGPITAAAQAMFDDADANGAGFVPGPGGIVAVILQGDGLGAGGYQDTIIEVPLPPEEDGEGCTPGFWRNPKKFDLWPIEPDTLFSDTFGVGPEDPLADTIRLGGGGEKALIRHGTAAYLNALSPDVAFFYSPTEVIQIVQNAFATGEFTAAKDMLEAQNDPTFCPFN
jgi:hypothetical protein